MCYVNSLEQIPLFIQLGIYYPQAIISMKQMKFTVLYTATMKGCWERVKKKKISQLTDQSKQFKAYRISFSATAAHLLLEQTLLSPSNNHHGDPDPPASGCWRPRWATRASPVCWALQWPSGSWQRGRATGWWDKAPHQKWTPAGCARPVVCGDGGGGTSQLCCQIKTDDNI